MTDSTTHIDTLRVRAPEEAAQQVQLRLSTTLRGGHLHPPGLAPAQMLLVRTLSDPEPRRLKVGGGATLDRTWERAVRDALNDCFHQAVRPTNGRVPPDAEAILFRDAAEAWACWSRVQGTDGPSPPPWWAQHLETSAEAPASVPGRSPSVAAAWRARPRLVPAMAAHLVEWKAAVDVLRQMKEAEADDILRAVCSVFEVPGPPPRQAPFDRGRDEQSTSRSPASEKREQDRLEERSPDPSRSAASAPRRDSPWSPFVDEGGGGRLAEALPGHGPARRQLLGVSLVLHDRPGLVRAGSFQSSWRVWRRSHSGADGVRSRSEGESTPLRRAADSDPSGDLKEEGRSAGRGESSPQERSPGEKDGIPADNRAQSGTGPEPSTAGEETGPAVKDESPPGDMYSATELGGVFYLVNVFVALDLPAAAATPPLGEHVGAWATLEALARALLGPDDEALRPNDPLWRVLATLDGRRPETPAGQALDDAEGMTEAFRMPLEWLEGSHVEPPIEGRWTVENDRLRMWTDHGCVADLEAANDADVQAEEEWARVPNTDPLQRAASADAMPRAPEPADCAPALATWAARTAPYVRDRLAAALGVDDRAADWIADLFRAEGRLYTTDVNVDLVLPLDAARTDARVAGLDRSPGWWPAGGRIVRFHFREPEA